MNSAPHVPASAGRPTVSVIMPIHNGAAYLRECVETEIRQTFRDWEFVIVDDASSDDTPAILQSIGDPRLRIHRNEQNLGLTRSLNRASSLAQGEYLARLDADDICLETRLESQVEILRHSQANVCFCDHETIAESDGFQRPQPAPAHRSVPWGYRLWNGLFGQTYGAHPAVMFRKATLDAVGGYDESFKYTQDFDLFDRFVASGERFAYTGQTGILYRWHSGQISQVKLSEQERLARIVMHRAIGRYVPEVTPMEIAGLAELLGRPRIAGDEHLPKGVQLMSSLLSAFEAKEGSAALDANAWADVLYHVSKSLPNLREVSDRKLAWTLTRRAARRAPVRRVVGSALRVMGAIHDHRKTSCA